MRVVSREDTPKSLRDNAEKWTNALLKAIEKSKTNDKKVPDKYYDQYKKNDIKEALLKMYGDGDFCYCCYCESIINDVSYVHIEHRMPKNKSESKYPEKTFDWNNLHLSCSRCNISKGTKYDENDPILDATEDAIKEHLGYELSNFKGVYRKTISNRGITTVKHADLDRKTLRTARLRVYLETIKAIKEIRRLEDDPRSYTAIKILRDKTTGEHGSLIEYLLDDAKVKSIE